MASKIEIGYEKWNGITIRKYFVGYEYVVLCDIPCLDLNEMSESEIEDALIALFKATEKYGVEIGLWDDVHVFDMPYNCVIASTKPIPKKVIEIAISTLREFCGGDGNE
jgi:hypothetical protein